jgi:hypothetical protein
MNGFRRLSTPKRLVLASTGTFGLLLIGDRVLTRADPEHDSVSGALFRALPTRALSAGWGRLHRRELSPTVANAAMGAWTAIFGCNMAEAEGWGACRYSFFFFGGESGGGGDRVFDCLFFVCFLWTARAKMEMRE